MDNRQLVIVFYGEISGGIDGAVAMDRAIGGDGNSCVHDTSPLANAPMISCRDNIAPLP